MVECWRVVDMMRLGRGSRVEDSPSHPSLCGSGVRFYSTVAIGKNSMIYYRAQLGWDATIGRDVSIGRKVDAVSKLVVGDGACIEGSIRFDKRVRIPRNACVIRSRHSRRGYDVIVARGSYRCHYDARRDQCMHRMR